MENRIRCFDAAKIAIDAASDIFYPVLVPKEEYVNSFRGYCECMDDIVKEFSCRSVDFNVDDETGRVTVALESSLFSIANKKHYLMQLFERAISISFKATDDCMAVIEMTFPSLWVHA